MKKCLSCRPVLLCLLLVASSRPLAQADVSLPKVIGSHMVLQRGRPLPIWGWAEPGEKVTVKFDEATATARQDAKGDWKGGVAVPAVLAATATADAHGDWKVVLPAMEADGKPHRMIISGKNKIELDDILIGEVWLASGQSNMAMGLADAEGGKEAVATAANPKIRLLHVPTVQAAQPAKDIGDGDAGKTKGPPAADASYPLAWKLSEPRTVQSFSAVLYFFGRRVQKDLDVPVGLIDSSWAGSFIEPWIPAGEKAGKMYNGMIAP